MFEGFPDVCRSYGVPADVRTLLLLRKGINKGLVHTLGDFYSFFKAILVKEPEMLGPYSQAFYSYFVGIKIKKGQKLNDAIQRSEVFKDWLEDVLSNHEDWANLDTSELIDRFLDEIHTTSYDIQRILNGKDILANDDPNQKDDNRADDDANANRLLDKAADYRQIDLEELRRRMEKVMEQQNRKHSGGNHWVGTSGISPYGHGGGALGGIRVGGSGGGQMARQVLDGDQFYPVDVNANISDDNIDAALAALKGVREESAELYLDIPLTVKTGVKEGGLFLPIQAEKTEDRLQILLFIDNGGFSMDYYIRPVQALFKKMKTRFQHDLETYYFHNTIYDYVYSDARRRNAVPIDQIIAKDGEYRVFVIGDAAMAPYELNDQSIESWTRMAGKFKKAAWLNPTTPKYWNIAYTTAILKRIIPMFPMTPKGVEGAVRNMNKKKSTN